MDKKKEDWTSGKSQNSDMNSCGCGGRTGTGYAAADSMNKSSASSMQDKSSNQFKDQGYKGSEAMNMDKQKDQKNQDSISGKSCKADRMDQSDSDNDVVYIETITAIYGPDDMSDSDYQDQDQKQNKDLTSKLNNNSEDLTDM